jgi:DNA-binding response OmpR family regulator
MRAKTIFIVEPDLVLQKSYVGALSTSGRQIITFRTANLAVRALEKVIPDIVILEIALPAHNGFEFIYELRSYADTRNVKVIVNSFVQDSVIPWGYVNREDLGIVQYLHKPFASLTDIVKAVNDII